MEHSKDTTRQQQGKGLNVDLGILELNVDLSIHGLHTLTDTLESALNQTGDKLSQGVNKVVDVVRQLGVDKIKNWVSQGGQEENKAYNQMVSKLQNAAGRGEAQARELLESLGEDVSHAGRSMQDAASEKDKRH